MDHKEILKNAEQGLISGNTKSKSYSELVQVATKYEQLFNEYEAEQKKVNELSIRNKNLKSVNETLLLQVLDKDFKSSTKTSENNTSGIDSLLQGIKLRG